MSDQASEINDIASALRTAATWMTGPKSEELSVLAERVQALGDTTQEAPTGTVGTPDVPPPAFTPADLASQAPADAGNTDPAAGPVIPAA